MSNVAIGSIVALALAFLVPDLCKILSFIKLKNPKHINPKTNPLSHDNSKAVHEKERKAIKEFKRNVDMKVLKYASKAKSKI